MAGGWIQEANNHGLKAHFFPFQGFPLPKDKVLLLHLTFKVPHSLVPSVISQTLSGELIQLIALLLHIITSWLHDSIPATRRSLSLHPRAPFPIPSLSFCSCSGPPRRSLSSLPSLEFLSPQAPASAQGHSDLDLSPASFWWAHV